MQVLVTGASGFIGSHLASALSGAGHQVRAFVRSREKLERALRPFPSFPIDVREGDVVDMTAVQQAVAGCDAVVNAANIYSYDPRMAKTMREVNVGGTANVLAAAVESECDPIVHISTAQISWPRVAGDPGPAPLAPLSGLAYSDSKKRAEQVAREWQDRGAPVVITYPGGVFGPDDPGPGEQATLLQTVLGPTAPFRIEGGFPACDIDWLVAVHLGLIEPGLGPRRVTCSGCYVTWEEWFDLARRLTGRDIRNRIPAPGWLIGLLGATMDTVQRVIPSRLPFGREPGWILRHSYGYPDEEAIAIAGPYPPLEETVARTVRWAVAAGHVTAEQAGSLVST